jgi:hypothetical protein
MRGKIWLENSLSQTFSLIIPQHFSNIVHSTHNYLPMKMEQSVPKRRHIKFRRRGITQKKAYNIQNTAKVWNQEFVGCLVIKSYVLLNGYRISLSFICRLRICTNVPRISIIYLRPFTKTLATPGTNCRISLTQLITPTLRFLPSWQTTKCPLCAVSLKSYLSERIQLPAKQQLLDSKHRIFSRSLSMLKSNRGHCPLSVRTESGQVTTALKCHKIFVSGWRLCSLFVRFCDHKYTNRKRKMGFGDSITVRVEVSSFVSPRGEYQSLTLALTSS